MTMFYKENLIESNKALYNVLKKQIYNCLSSTVDLTIHS